MRLWLSLPRCCKLHTSISLLEQLLALYRYNTHTLHIQPEVFSFVDSPCIFLNARKARRRNAGDKVRESVSRLSRHDRAEEKGEERNESLDLHGDG